MTSPAAPPGPADRTTFFEEQARHRRRTRRFVVFAAVAVALAGIPVSLIATPVLYLVALTVAHLIQLVKPLPPALWTAVDHAGQAVPRLLEQIERAATLGTLAPIDWTALATMAALLAVPGMVLMLWLWLWVRLLFRKAGTEGMLLRIRARAPNENDLEERQLVNVVHEMAIAAGIRPLPVRILDSPAPNAAVVGQGVEDGHLVVTRGLLDTLSRDETQGVVAHLIGSVGNGDLRMASILLSVWQTFGLLAIILSAPTTRGARAQLWSTVKSIFRRRGHSETERVAILLATDEVDTSGDSSGGCLSPLIAPFAIAGLTTQLLTSLGTWLFYGPLLTAAWRSRRFLADATAVQLTRNPNGIAHALQRLGQHEVTFDAGATAAPLFVHWPGSVGAKGWPSLGRFHPDLARRVHRLELSGAKRLRFSIEGATSPRMGCFRPLVWILNGVVAVLMVAGVVVAIAAAAMMMMISFAFVGGALFAIHAFFTNLPAITHFVMTDLPRIGGQLFKLARDLWSRSAH